MKPALQDITTHRHRALTALIAFSVAFCAKFLSPKNARYWIIGWHLYRRVEAVSTQIANLFPKAPEIVVPDNISSRVRGERHNRQLLDRVSAYSTDVFRRSIFGTVQCYNALPQNVVEKPSVSSFQRALQAALSHQAELGASNWQGMFSDGRRYASALRFQSLFRHN